jgi:GAF domain-containing protein
VAVAVTGGSALPSDAESVLAALSRIVQDRDVRDGELEARLDEVVNTAAAIFAAAGAGVMLFNDDATLRLVGATNDAARALEHVQQEMREGPGLDTCRTGQMVVVVDLARDPRWPRLAAAVVPQGVASVLSAPIWVRDQAVGNLNLFDGDRREWSDIDQTGLMALAGAAGAIIGIAIGADQTGHLVAELQQLLMSGDLPRREGFA